MEYTFGAGANGNGAGKVDPRTGTRTDADSDTGSFRRLLDDELSPDEYVERVDERVRERHEADEAAQNSDDREGSKTARIDRA